MDRRALTLGSLLIAAVLVLDACGAQHDASTRPPGAISVSRSDCGSSWRPSAGGEQFLRLHNEDSNPGEVQLVGSGTHQGLVYATVEPFGAGTTVDLHLRLGSGRYALACLMEDSAPVTGPVHTIAGVAGGTPGVRILTQSELVPAALHYERWVRGQLGPLRRDTHLLREAVDRGDLGAARVRWLTAHLDYQRLGATYDAFGDLGDAIDGLPDGLPGGTSNPAWSGFHAVEDSLWGHGTVDRPTDRPMDQLRARVARLDRAVGQLSALVRSTHLDPLDLTLRAHEISENALQVQLTGRDDFGSHTELQSIRAELVGTQAVLSALAGPIDARVHDAAGIRAVLRRTLATFTQAIGSGQRVPVSGLPRERRERLDAALGLLTQRLAPIPATLEPRLTVASGSIEGGNS